jgi:Icc-related predicted phosphoesterase
MVLLCLSDIHGAGAGAAEVVRGSRADLVVLGGDLTHLGGAREAAAILEPIVETGARVVAVPGNMDRPEVADYLERSGVLLHGRGRLIDGIGLFGLGGANRTPFGTPFEVADDEAAAALAAGWQAVADAPVRVLVSHAPPRGTRIDRTATGLHAGSTAVRGFLEGHDVALVISGHIHEAEGEDTVGRTRCINTGAWKNGRYAVVTIDASEAGGPRIAVEWRSGGPREGPGGRKR